MVIKRIGSQPSNKGPEAYFTGVVRIDSPFSDSGGLSGATVTFEPGARTAWHPHPHGRRCSSPPASARLTSGTRSRV